MAALPRPRHLILSECIRGLVLAWAKITYKKEVNDSLIQNTFWVKRARKKEQTTGKTEKIPEEKTTPDNRAGRLGRKFSRHLAGPKVIPQSH